jgi:hypothetical protein
MATEELILMVISLIGGILGMPLISWLKGKLGLDETSALAIAVAVSGVIAIVVLLVTGQLTTLDFTWENLPGVLALVWSTATLVYNMLRGKKA